MAKSPVYFLKDIKKLNISLNKVLEGYFPRNSNLSIKIHFGEPSNKASFVPKDIKPVTDFLKEQEVDFFLTDTPVAYISPRNTPQGYLLVTKLKGYDKLGKCIISKKYMNVKTKDFTAEVSRELVGSDGALVISHVKGHSCSGFGGAIKNLGMGGVSKKTKIIIHNLCKPVLTKESCISCGLCEKVCPAKAIKIKNKYPQIDLENCLGCSICENKCPTKSLRPKAILFDDLLAQGAAAVINNFPKKTFYINFLKNIVENCDCSNNPGKTLCKDLGILFSDNPVAIDKASVDLINKESGKDLFNERFNKNPYLHLKEAAKYTKFKEDYLLKEI